MKRPFLVLIALAATAGFGTWLVRTPHGLHEILTACAGWVLGFWVAAAILSRRRPRRTDEPDDEDDWEEEWEEEPEGDEEDERE